MKTDNGTQPQDPWDDDEPARPVIPQALLNILSVLLVVGLILGSAGVIVALTDWGLTAGALLGLVVALVLAVSWLRMPTRGPRA